jgi:hypothetical protein
MHSDAWPVLDAKSKALVQSWNRDVTKSGVIRNHLATVGKPSQVYTSSAAMADMPLPKCKQCHDPATGIRSELKRLHESSIGFLVTHGDQPDGTTAPTPGALAVGPSHNSFIKGTSEHPAMPIEDESLTPSEVQCLVGWLQDNKVTKDCHPQISRSDFPRHPQVSRSGSTRHPQVSRSETVGDLVTWSVEGTDKALVKTSVSSFTIEGLRLTGAVRCSENKCTVDAAIDLSTATSGIKLRDRHIKDKLATTERYEAVLQSPPVNWPSFTAEMQTITLPAKLAIANVIAPLTLTLTCKVMSSSEITCRIDPFQWDMRLHAVSPPELLGVRVSPLVQLESDLRLKQIAYSQANSG